MTRVSWGAFAVIVSSGLSTGAAFDVDSSCTGLENFALDCIGLGVTDDGFDEMCSTFKETVADPQCIDQVRRRTDANNKNPSYASAQKAS